MMATYSVPNLELDVFLVDLDGAGTELHTNGEIVLLSEAFVSELQEETTFTDA